MCGHWRNPGLTRLPPAKSFDQAVSLTFTRKLPKPKGRGGSKKIAVTLGGGAGTMPRIGVGVPAEEADNAISAADALKAAGLQQLICQIDCRRGDATALCRRYKQLGDATGAGVVLEIILTGAESPEAELARVGGQAKVAGLQPMAVAVSPAPDLKATLPGSAGPKVAPLADIYKAARAAFPGVRLGGGMFSYFTELNRKRPPVELLDYVTHTNAPIVHAADDISVMETLEALPYVIDSTRSFIGKKTPYWVGPSSIAARDNPYGAATAANPDNQRICLADRDPRHRGLFGAAWTLGYIAAFARGGVEAVNLAAATGPRGLLYRPTDTPQPYFDDVKRGFYPLYHVIAGTGWCGRQEADRRRQRRADEGGERGVPRCRRAGGVAGESDRREADRAGQGLQAGTGGDLPARRGQLCRGNEAAGFPRQADQEGQEDAGLDPAAALRGRAHRRGLLTNR